MSADGATNAHMRTHTRGEGALCCVVVCLSTWTPLTPSSSFFFFFLFSLLYHSQHGYEASSVKLPFMQQFPVIKNLSVVPKKSSTCLLPVMRNETLGRIRKKPTYKVGHSEESARAPPGVFPQPWQCNQCNQYLSALISILPPRLW